MRTLLQRFENKYTPEPNSGCWLWVASGDRYGSIAKEDGRTLEAAHRVAWRLFCGAIPDGLNVLHTCDVTYCVNPRHLFLGTQADNVADMARKRRHRAHRGWPLSWQKLSSADMQTIIKADGRHREIANLFGVTRARVSQIKRAAQGR